MVECTIEKPDPQALWDKIENEFSLTVLNGGDVIPESNEWYVVALNFAMTKEFYSLAEMMWRERDPRYACCDNLYQIARANGIYPRPAASAQGFVRLTGEAGVALTQNIVVEFNGVRYAASGTVPAAMSSGGFVVIRVKAIDPGPEGNDVSGQGALITEITGVDTIVTAYGTGFCGGENEEDCEVFRNRYLERMAYTNNADIKWIKERAAAYPCVSMVCEKGDACCTLDENGNPICPDRIELYFLFDGTFDCGLAPQCIIDDINEWLFGTPSGYGAGQLPFGMCGEVLFVQPAYVDIALDGFACYTAAQRNEVEARIREYFLTICPSESVTARAIEMIAAQVVGNSDNWSISLRLSDESGLNDDCLTNCAQESLCGDITVGCDYRACLNNIEFVNADVNATGCV